MGSACAGGAARAGELELRHSGGSGMSSNLSSPQFSDIDLVVAVTQRSVNATMLQYLHEIGQTAPEVIRCYVFESFGSSTILEIDHQTLVKNAHGSDPFNVKDGANQSDPDVTNLGYALFVGAFRARGGLPNIPPNELPELVALGIHSDSPVTFTLTSSEFQIVGMSYFSGGATATNVVQPSAPGAQPWYFQFHVDMAQVPENPGAPVPPAVRQRIDDLLASAGPGAFSIQKLLLQLNSALLTATPMIPGVSDKDQLKPLWTTMSKIFIGAYFDEMRKKGSPVFNYSVTTTPAAPASTLELQAIRHSTSPYMVNHDYTVSPACCLSYLCTTRTSPPGIVPFPWSWVDEGDVSQMAGVIAVRRAAFTNWLEEQLKYPSSKLCYDTWVSLNHHGEDFSIAWSFPPAQSPQWFKVIEPEADGPNGGFVTLKMAFEHKAHDSSMDALHTMSIYMDYNSYVDGTVTFSAAKIIIYVRVRVEMGYNHHERGVHYTDLPLRSYYDKRHTVTYDLAVTQKGQLSATMTEQVEDHSAKWAFDPKGIAGKFGTESKLKNGMAESQKHLNSRLDRIFTGYTDMIDTMLNGYGQWVFPGADSFIMHDVSFSHTCDLVTQITYSDPVKQVALKKASGSAGQLERLRTAQSPKDLPKDVAPPSYTIKVSAELMTNFVQSDILQPQKAFEALQTDEGLSLLFAISTEGDLNVVVEETGKTKHGWAVRNLSAPLIRKVFQGGEAKVRTFAVSQVAGRGAQRAIRVAMVVEAGGMSHLFLSLGNSDCNLDWTKDIPWVAAPYNAVDDEGKPYIAPRPFHIAGVMLAKAADCEMIVVDVLRNPNASQPLLERYWIKVGSPGPKYTWVKHTAPADFEASTYTSCLGRKANEYVDGIYTAGKVNNKSQLIYAPVYNVWDAGAPALPSRLQLPGGKVPDCVACAHRSTGDNTTDLYVAARGALYYFAANNQHDQAVGVAVVEHPTLLNGVRTMFAVEEAGEVTVWALNGSNEVFYLSCHSDAILHKSEWSVPLPIYSQVDAISPYIDRKHLANTFFAHTGTDLIKVTKTPGTGLWTKRNLLLPASDATQDSREIKSFTTEVQVTNKGTGELAADVEVELTATTVTSVSINHLYYAVGPQPVKVKTDTEGTVTIVELTHDLVATRFSASVAPAGAVGPGSRRLPGGAPPVAIHPMDGAFKRNAALNTRSKLRDAKVQEMDGSERPFISSDVSDDALDQIAKLNDSLNDAHEDAKTRGMPLHARRLAHTRSFGAPVFAEAHLKGKSPFLCDIGDLFNYLKSGIQAAISFAKDHGGIWYFLAEIGDSIMTAVLDTVEAIGSAVVWVYDKIIAGIEWVIKMIEFLFGWQDILVTHRVIKKFIVLTAQDFIDSIPNAKAAFKNSCDGFKKNIADWTGMKVEGLNDTPADANKNQSMHHRDSAPGNTGKHHLKGGGRQATSDDKPDGGVPSILSKLCDLAQKEEQTLVNAADQIKTQVIDPFTSLSLTQIVERITGIVGIAIVDGFENIGLELFDVVESMVSGLMDKLDKALHIPVLSWLYKMLTGDQLSVLDLVCLIAAIPTTIAAKVIYGHAPFSKHSEVTKRMLNAKTIQDWNNAPWDQSRALALYRPGVPKVHLHAKAEGKDVEKHKALQALALGFGALMGTVLRCYCTVIKDELKRDPAMGNDALYLFETLRWIGSVAGSAPSLSPEMFDKLGDSSAWYYNMGKILTTMGKVRGFVQIFFVASKNKAIGKAFSLCSSFENTLKLIPHIASPIYDGELSVHIVLKTIGKISSDAGGILSFPKKVSESPQKEELMLAEVALRMSYGVIMAGYPLVWMAEI